MRTISSATHAAGTVCAAVPFLAGETGTDLGEEDRVIDVTLSGFDIEMPETIEAGDVTLEIVNDGRRAHNITVDEPSLDERTLDDVLEPSEKGSMELTLEPGEYAVSCPICNHRRRGMETCFTVTPPMLHLLHVPGARPTLRR